MRPTNERALADAARALLRGECALVEEIRRGGDPLGEALTAIRSPRARRPMGATYTPPAIVDAMIEWARRTKSASPARVIDPGAGSGRFVVAAGRAFPRAELVAIELDPLAALLARAHLHAAGMTERARVLLADYRAVALPPARGASLFVGNPPYVRHHGIAREWKQWLVEGARAHGIRASALAGLHAHFFLATATHAREGDYGAFITAAEWLDVNYGALVRRLFAGVLGGSELHVIDPAARPFVDADTTAAIACFEIGSKIRGVRVRRVTTLERLAPLSGGREVPRDALASASRWTPFLRDARKVPRGFVELGEICRVHRGQATGMNDVWIAGAHSTKLPPAVLFPAVTRARELFEAGARLVDERALRRVIDLPIDLDVLEPEARHAVAAFLRIAESMGARDRFLARHRRAWWAVGLRAPAPILATYMARRPPAFVRNLARARHINIAHGLYPRTPMSDAALDALATSLTSIARVEDGRTYAGGLTKFEPKEMERLLVPIPDEK